MGLLDSDDWYEPGALAAMQQRASHDGADVVIAPFHKQDKGRKSMLPTLRSRNLNPVRGGLLLNPASVLLERETDIRRNAVMYLARLKEDLGSRAGKLRRSSARK